jgi:outer membrane cobalamin receptor
MHDFGYPGLCCLAKPRKQSAHLDEKNISQNFSFISDNMVIITGKVLYLAPNVTELFYFYFENSSTPHASRWSPE